MATTTNKLMAGLLGLTIAAVTGCDQGDEASTVGREGGLVVSADGRVALDVPAGALADDVEITIEAVDEGPEGMIGIAYQIEPAGLVLARPATITFDLDAGETTRGLNLADAVAVEDLALVTERAGGWERLADREDDIDDLTVSGSVLFFGSFAIAPR